MASLPSMSTQKVALNSHLAAEPIIRLFVSIGYARRLCSVAQCARPSN